MSKNYQKKSILYQLSICLWPISAKAVEINIARVLANLLKKLGLSFPREEAAFISKPHLQEKNNLIMKKKCI